MAVNIAAKILQAHAAERPISLLQRCHEGLRGTRGAALSVASIQTSSGFMTWSGVGNVEVSWYVGTTTSATIGGPRQPCRGGRPHAGRPWPLRSCPWRWETPRLHDGRSLPWIHEADFPRCASKRTADLILAATARIDDALVVVACY